jgi:methionyl-tRNA formyltransferase
LRVVFWGTPDFAVPSLRALLGEGHDVAAVVTQPDRPAGRGRAVRPTPVKAVAVDERVPVLQPEQPAGDGFLAELAGFAPDLNVVVAYGRILRRAVLDAPRLGSINVHASLLPELRGAAPIQWAIARGHAETGITVMRMVERMDAGPILLQVAQPIGPEDTGTDLTARLAEVGAAALVEALTLMEAGRLREVEQDETRATFAPRITREASRVDWSATALAVDCHIRAFDAVPGAWTLFEGEPLQLFRPRPVPQYAHETTPGTLLEVAPHDPAAGMLVACGSGAVRVREVKPAGRRRMATAAWLRGRGIATGAVLT